MMKPRSFSRSFISGDEGWYERIGSDDNPLADSIMDRIKYDAYKIKIQALDPDHDRSMREVYGLSPEEAE